MAYHPARDMHVSGICPRCGRGVSGWLSIPDPKTHYRKEHHECMECGYEYFSQERQLTPEAAAKHKGNLSLVPTAARCRNCAKSMGFRSRKWDVPSRKHLWGYELEYVCFECGFWYAEGASGLTLEEVNQRRTCRNLPPLSGLLEEALDQHEAG